MRMTCGRACFAYGRSACRVMISMTVIGMTVMAVLRRMSFMVIMMAVIVTMAMIIRTSGATEIVLRKKYIKLAYYLQSCKSAKTPHKPSENLATRTVLI